MTRNLASLPGQLAETLGQRGRELEDRAGLGAAQLVVELVDDHAGTDAVQEVAGGEAFDGLAVDRARDVDRRVRVVDERELGVGEIGEPFAQRVDLLVDVVVGDGLERQLDAQLVVADELHLRTDLDDRVELDVAVVLAGRDLDLGRRDDVDVVLVHRVDVVLGQRVLQRLLARDVGAEPRLEQPARRLARTEARDADLAGELAERGVDRPLELGRRDRRRGA